MGVPRALVGVAWVASCLLKLVCCQEGACLQDGRHKATPSPEPYLTECSLYMENACCSEQDIEDLTAPPAGGPDIAPWDRCGALSAACTSFLKRVVCFHRCSPDAAHWPHPQRDSSLKAVPLCHSFCRDWYDACETDLTCAREWAVDPRGFNCTGSCVPYRQMYQHGRDLCESLWGDAFMTVEDEAGEVDGVEGQGCGCLTLSPSDQEVIAALRAQRDNPEELDTTKHGLPQYRAPCTHTSAAPPQAWRSNDNAVLRKRSLPGPDTEGSASGF
ncbi:retbindin [Brachyhypopomus gauderio]|uniref:retbindin n=1 Tax=Brachyhypopomus gauderio TaxID=698409 RepID=UPI004042AC8D